MKRIKKFFVLILVLTLIGSNATVSFAAKDLSDVEIAGLLGVLKGDGNGLTDEYLAKKTTRLQAAIMCLRLNGLEDEALQYTGKNTFVDANELNWVVGRSILAYLKDHPELGWQGDNKGEFKPYEIISSQAYTKVMLEALGYRQDVDFTWSEVFSFAKQKGLVKSANIEKFTNRDIAVVTVETLKVNNSEGIKLIDQLIVDKVIDQGLAEYCGLYNSVTISDIQSAVALNSKVIEVKLTEATEAVDTSVFKVKSDNKMISIVSAEIAPWDKDKKTVLLTLDNHLTSGELYSVTGGNTMANFGGRGTDTTQPTVSKAKGVDYNEVILEFSEPVRIDSLRIDIAEKYYNRAALEVKGMEYINSRTIRVMTADQRDATLYGLNIRDARDLAGNVMKTEDTLTFVGVAKSTAPQSVKKAKAIDYNQIYIEFNTNVDVNSIDTATFEVMQVYQGSTPVQVFSASQPTAAQAVAYNPSLTSDTDKEAAIKKGVLLTVEGTMSDSRLYKVIVKDLYTLYGKAMSSNSYERETNFVGMAKPTGSFAYASSKAIIPGSATSLNVVFERKINKDLAEDISNYTIIEAYASNYSLPILSVELQDDEKTVKLIVGEMKGVLYKLTTKNLIDIYGNSQKTGQDAEKTFVGQIKEAKISQIKSIIRIANSDKDIKVTFNAKVGSNAKDVALYVINNGIGYPEAVTTYSDDPYSVKITLPKTTETVSYKLTVKGLYNADGVAMDSNGVYGYFTGKGISTGLPVLQAAMSVDKHTVKLYFDRDVTSPTIKGVLWAVNSIDDVAPFFNKKTSSSNSYVTLMGLKAYQDSRDKNALVVVDDDESWTTGNGFNIYNVDLTSNYENKKVRFDTNTSYLEVVARDNPYTYPVVEGVQGIDDNTVKIFFSKPIHDLPSGAVSIRKTSNNQVINVTKEPVPINGTNNMQWLIPVDNDMEYVSYQITLIYGSVVDKYLTSKALSTHMNEQKFTNVVKEFAGNGTDANHISNVYAMMTNDRTVEVYYPENMYYQPDVVNNNTPTASTNQNVDNINGYLIRQVDGYNNVPGSTPIIKYIAYDDVNNKATLYLDRGFDSNVSTFGLVVNTHIANVTRNKTVAESSSSNNAKVIEVVNNKNVINRGPGIQNAIVSGDRMKLTVTMDSVIAFGDGTHAVDTGSVYESIDTFVNKTTDDTVTASTPKTKTINVTTDILKALKIVTTFVGESEGTIESSDINNITLAVNGKTLVFTFKKAIAAGANGYVTTKTGNTTANTDLYNYSMVKRSKTDYESMVAFAAPNSSVYDYTDPEVAYVTAQQKTYVNGENLDVTLVFTENVSISDGNRDSKISLNIGGVTKEAQLYSMTANTATFRYVVESGLVDSDGIDVIDNSLVLGANDSITDNNGNHLVLTTLNATNLANVNVDSSALSVANITAANKTYVEGENIDVTLTFNRNVTVTDTNKDSKIVLIIGGVEKDATLESITTNSATFRYQVEAGLADADGIDVKDNSLTLGSGDSIKDTHNNDLDLTTVNLTNLTDVKVDSTAFSITTVTASSKTYGITENIDVTLTFNKNITVTDTAPAKDSKIVLNIGGTEKDAILYTTGTNTATFRYQVEAGLTDANGIDVNENSLTLGAGDSIQDPNGNNLDLTSLSATHLSDVKVDSTPVTITSVTALNDTYGVNEFVDVTLTFNKDVTITDSVPTNDSKIVLIIGGTEKDAKLYSTTANTATFRYQVQAGLVDADGIDVKNDSLTLETGDSIKDSSNNSLDETSLNATNLANTRIDAQVPTITNITATDKTYGASEAIDIVLTFSKNVTIIDLNKDSSIKLDIDGAEKLATLHDTTANTATYRYVVEGNLSDANGIDVKANGLTLNAGDSIKDITGNNLNTNYILKNFAGVIVDSDVPAVMSVTAANGTYHDSDHIDIVLTFSENVTFVDNGLTNDSIITLTIGVTDVTANYLSNTGDTVTFRYTVAGGLIDNDGIVVKNDSLVLNTGDTIRDVDTNDAILTTLNLTQLSGVIVQP